MAFARTEVKELEPMVKSGKKRFVRYQEGAELYSMGLHTFEQLAKEAGAIYKIRRVVLVNGCVRRSDPRKEESIYDRIAECAARAVKSDAI